jgi:hypothetical protein
MCLVQQNPKDHDKKEHKEHSVTLALQLKHTPQLEH